MYVSPMKCNSFLLVAQFFYVCSPIFPQRKDTNRVFWGSIFLHKLSCISQWKCTIRVFWGLNFSTYPLLFSTKKRHLIFSSLNGPILFLTPDYSWLILFLNSHTTHSTSSIVDPLIWTHTHVLITNEVQCMLLVAQFFYVFSPIFPQRKVTNRVF